VAASRIRFICCTCRCGYTILTAAAPVRNAELWTAAIVSGAVVLAWATWRFVERAVHRWTKNYMTAIAAKLGWKSVPKAQAARSPRLDQHSGTENYSWSRALPPWASATSRTIATLARDSLDCGSSGDSVGDQASRHTRPAVRLVSAAAPTLPPMSCFSVVERWTIRAWARYGYPLSNPKPEKLRCHSLHCVEGVADTDGSTLMAMTTTSET